MEELEDQVKDYLQKEETDKAIELLETVISNEVDENKIITAYLLKYQIFTNKGKYKDVIEGIKNILPDFTKISNINRSQLLYYKSTAETALGKYDEAWNSLYPTLDILDNDIGDIKEILKIKASIYNRLGSIKINQGDFSEGTSFIEDSLEIRKKIGNKASIAQSLYNLGTTYFQMGKLNKAITYLENTLEIYEELNLQRGIAFCKMELGGIYEKQGQLDDALEYFVEAHNLYKELGNEQQIAWSLTDLGNIHQSMGEIGKSLKYYRSALPYYETFDDPRTVANHKRAMAISYRAQGEYEKALQLNNEALENYQKIGNTPYEARAYKEIGQDFHAINNMEKALLNYNRAKEILEEENNEAQLGKLYYLYIKCHLEEGNLTKTTQYLEKLGSVVHRTKNQLIEQSLRLAEGFIFSNENRLISLGKAQQKFRSVISDEIKNFEITTDAAYALAESLLNEFEALKNNEILEELKSHIYYLEELARSQNSPPLRIESMVIQSKLLLLEAKLDDSKSVLSTAYNIAHSKGYKFLEKKVVRQIDLLLDREDELRTMFGQNKYSTDQILEISGLKNYVKNILTNTRTDLGINEETALYFTIINKGGSALYTKDFNNVGYDDQLIGGFLTAISSFAKETFDSKEDELDQLRIGDNTLSIHRFNNFAFCYVYRGSSYFAFEKLELLIDKINQNLELIEIMEESDKKSQTISNKEFDSIVNSVLVS